MSRHLKYHQIKMPAWSVSISGAKLPRPECQSATRINGCINSCEVVTAGQREQTERTATSFDRALNEEGPLRAFRQMKTFENEHVLEMLLLLNCFDKGKPFLSLVMAKPQVAAAAASHQVKTKGIYLGGKKGKPTWRHQSKNTRNLHWYNLFKAVIYLDFLFNQITGRRRVHGQREQSSTSHHKPEEATLEIHYAINRDETNSLCPTRDSYAILCVLVDSLNDCVRRNNHMKVGTEEMSRRTQENNKPSTRLATRSRLVTDTLGSLPSPYGSNNSLTLLLRDPQPR